MLQVDRVITHPLMLESYQSTIPSFILLCLFGSRDMRILPWQYPAHSFCVTVNVVIIPAILMFYWKRTVSLEDIEQVNIKSS